MKEVKRDEPRAGGTTALRGPFRCQTYHTHIRSILVVHRSPKGDRLEPLNCLGALLSDVSRNLVQRPAPLQPLKRTRSRDNFRLVTGPKRAHLSASL